MEFASINTPAAAFVAGLVTSLHCAGMCGPLTCMMAPAREDRVDPFTVATVYHGARLVGYAILGAVAGGLGRLPFDLAGGSAVSVLPWVLVGFFLVVGLRLEKRLPRLAVLTRLQWKLQSALRGRSRLRMAAVMGAATPILPCGPLYFLIAISAFAGSGVRGAEFMLAFGLGTVPLLWLVQANYGRLQLKLTPAVLGRVQAGLALVTALVLTWRLSAQGGDFLCR
ncbi:sulfite exporter TauE/SafE family protein [Rariglobus hedericola]|uniref:Sulfite exporter TauE/SafE family protein n=1 Tax=Rariglobus hedericola TaxID=2597822 RepID=A0A556QRC5_9BACT|nr:sulfite exporter TauE/SafE family protein [Rariglobus hedericola]TSJ79195.1 sulfite exporter TauE/SafE family protein [Rariglobus hedericola]